MWPPTSQNIKRNFVPHLWTEFTESIDVAGARKNRIESATNLADVLEVVAIVLPGCSPETNPLFLSVCTARSC